MSTMNSMLAVLSIIAKNGGLVKRHRLEGLTDIVKFQRKNNLTEIERRASVLCMLTDRYSAH